MEPHNNGTDSEYLNEGNELENNPSGQESPFDTPIPPGEEPNKQQSKKTTGFGATWILVSVFLVVTAILLTYTLTSVVQRNRYTEALQSLYCADSADSSAKDSANFRILESILASNSFYAESLDSEAMLEAAFHAYVAASGDDYAEYYTEEEYQSLMEETSGQYVGIGVTVSQKTVTVGDSQDVLIHIDKVEASSPAAEAGILVNDDIVAVLTEGEWKTVTELGYLGAVTAIRGEEGTTVDLKIQTGDVTKTVQCERRKMDTESVTGEILSSDPTVGLIRISEFRLNTPAQFEDAVNTCLQGGATRFIFDVRDNPGGDLRSIRAVLSYFLQEGNLILAARDKDGNMSAQNETRCAVVTYTGEGAECSITKEQIGQYRNLDFVVLCNENTASAAEVFTAVLRDYSLSKSTVGKKTFGKGIMQSIFEIPFQGIKGYIKLTTYEYITQSSYPDGPSYHGIGILPDVVVERKEGTENKASSVLSYEEDTQLQTAVSVLTATD